MTQLKTCTHPGCEFQFPAHYFDDKCIEHTTAEDDAAAQARCKALLARGPEAAVVNALTSLAIEDPEEARRTREALLRLPIQDC